MQQAGSAFTVAVDLDDVVLAFREGLIESLRLEFGIETTMSDYTEWDTPLLMAHTATFKAAGYKDGWAWLRERDWLWGKVFKAIPGAIGGIAKLRAAGFYVECLTAKPKWAEHVVWDFQGRYRVPFNRITVVENKQHKARESDALVLVDDKPQNCTEWVATDLTDLGEMRPRMAVLFDRPWNQQVPFTTNVLRAMDWNEVVKLVQLIREETAR